MRDAPAYSAERFPGDFAASVVCGVVTAILLGPLVWWCSRCYLFQRFPQHTEMQGAAVVAGILDGLLLGILAAVICFAVRVWRLERRQRKQSDDALRAELQSMIRCSDASDGTGDTPSAPSQ